MIEVKNLCKKYDKKEILKNISFSISNHEFLVILGPSGSGKSTLLRLISGIEEFDSGKVIINGLEKNKNELINETATIFQSFGLFPNMNVYNNIAFPIRKEDKKTKDLKVKNIAKILKIESLLNRKVTKLSGGEAQRVSIARALVRNVNIYLFDEPLSSLDEHLKKDLIKEIKSTYDNDKKLYIYVTHNQEEAKILSSKVLILNNGQIYGFGKYEDLYNNPKNLFVAEFLSPLNKIESKVISKNNLYYLTIYNKLYPLDEKKYNYRKLKKYRNQNVILGIRPSDIEIVNNGIKMKIDSSIDFNLYKRYFIKNNNLELIIDTNKLINNKEINIELNKNIMLFDKNTLNRIN